MFVNNLDMADLEDRLAKLSPAQRTRLQERLLSRAASKIKAAAEATPSATSVPITPTEPGKPIAIIGMACRFAGAPDLESYWRLIRDGREGTTEVPPDRWPIDEFYDPEGGPGKSVTRRGAFVEGIDLFEPTFFGVTPREAARMDPQQRLLLEIAWETLENAGCPADQMAGTATGVYVGVGGTDYMKIPVREPDYFQLIDAHVGTGNALSIASNRVSYSLDLRGPSLSVDTACSSGSLAVHLAMESLRRGESNAALAGGANLIMAPDVTIAFSNSHMLSPEGRCRSYDANASGYVRGEGCAFVLLKRLEDAQRDGDDIRGVLLGTAVNQDGRTPGIAAPSVLQQQACLRAALADADLSPEDIDYVEGHGTGTPLGDPIELQALAHVFPKQGEDDRPLWVTSVKGNIGHTETVSGVAGLIKTVLLMEHQTVPPQPFLEKLNPHVQIGKSRVEPLTEQKDWPSRLADGGRRRVAGVSSFGFGGTNTHLVVAEPPLRAKPKPRPERTTHVVKLAAKTADRIPEQAQRLAQWLRSEDGFEATVADVAYTMNTGRSDFPHRVAITADNRPSLLERLDAIAAGDTAETSGTACEKPRVAWLFTGQGSQRAAMGLELYNSEPIFRRVIDRCDAVLANQGVDSLIEVLRAEDGRIDQTRYTQPAIFAVECGLAALWKSWGVTPDVVLGHSIGEFAAAVTAGVLSLEDGARLVAERARLMHTAPGDGAMAVLFAPEATVAEALAGREASLSIAAVNGPENTVLSGDAIELEAVLKELSDRGITAKRLTVSHAFHSPLMDPVLDEFERFAATIEHLPPQLPIASNVTGGLITAESVPEDWAAYWRNHLRGTVRFADGVTATAERRAKHWIEVGPAPILAAMAARCDTEFAAKPEWIASLRPGTPEATTLAQAVATHWEGGGHVDWRAWDRDRPRRRLPLPNYPMRRERYWYENLQPSGAGKVAQAASGSSPVLGGRLPMAAGGAVFEAPIDTRTPAWLVDHQVQGSIVAPGAMFVEQALAAAAALGEPGGPLRVDGVTIRQALVPAKGERLRVQTLVERESAGRRRLTIHAAPANETDPKWTEHAEATLVTTPTNDSPTKLDRGGFDQRVVERQTRQEFYALVGERGLVYGNAFRVLDDVKRSAYDATADVVPSKSVSSDLSRYHLHPAIGDALLQTVAATLPLEADGSYSPHTYLPVRIDSVRLHRPIERGEPLTAHAIRRDPAPNDTQPSPETVEADSLLLDGAGRPVAELLGVRLQKLARQGPAGEQASQPADWLYQIDWRPAPFGEAEIASWPIGPTLLFADHSGVAEELLHAIESRGGGCLVVRHGAGFKSEVDESAAGGRTQITIDPDDPSHYERLIGLLASNPAGKPAAVVHAWSLDANDWDQAESLGVGSVMRLTQQLARRGLSPALGVSLVTRNAQAVGTEGEQPTSPHSAAVLGFGRVAAMEHPELGVRLFDTDGPLPLEALLADNGENQVAFRSGERFAARLTKADSLAHAAASQEGTPVPDSASWRLALRRAGSFDGLAYEPAERVAPGPGQVQMKVHATGLNFSDVLKALGLYPGIKDAVVPLGIEASGVVTAVGEGVEHLAVGDPAIGVLPYAFASHATTAAYAVVPKPAGISHEEGTTIPIVFLTAHYALERLAQLQPGERVLIHAAAGGVGLAALQIAQHVGAEVFATAGSDEKRDLLRSLGVRHVFDSRSLDFVQQIREATGGEGVDVVLNSLPGEAIDASLGLLRAYGRFCEIGKIDIYGDRKIGLLPFQDNLSYFAIDLDRLLRERPEQVQRLFAEVMQRFAEGAYKPLPLTRFAIPQTPDAFRYMSQRKNIGKVVVSMQPEEAANDPGTAVRGGGYLVTGGLGALGRRVARWLVQQGAGGVALLSRREADDAFLDELREVGVQAVCLRGDVADRASLDAALATLPKGFPTIAGVIHAAGVLDDGLIADLNAERLQRVLRPKAVGAWHLHEATLDTDSPLAGVEQFVLFSSVAATLGSPGQANYAAANAALDALATHRRAQGLPATSLAWGPWASDSGTGEGMAAGETADAVRSKGMDLLPPDASLRLMGGLVRAGAGAVAVFDARWEAMSRLLAGRGTPLLEDLLTQADQAAAGDSELRTRLLAAPADQRHAELVAMVRAELARVTSVAAEEIDPAAPLTSIGIDSLMALELKNNLEAKLSITLPMGKLLAGPSVVSLAEAAAEELVGDTPGSPAQAEWRPLVTLREGTAGVAPLFLMPVLGGDVGAYHALAKAFDDDQPVIAIRPRGLDTDDPPHNRIQETAADYAAAIRATYPDGPYHLGGWSTGGITALAVAQRIEAAGGRVAGVSLFDTPPPSIYDEIDPEDDAAFLSIVVEFVARFTGVEAQPLDSVGLAKLPEAERFSSVLADAKRAGLVPADVDEGYVRRLVAVGEALVVATQGYRPQEIAAPIAFFTPETAGGLDGVTKLTGLSITTWRAQFGEALTEHLAEGDHFTMMRGEGAKAIAAALSDK